MTSRRVVWIVGIAVAVVLAVILTINGIHSAQVNGKLRQCELKHPIGSAQYDACADHARR